MLILSGILGTCILKCFYCNIGFLIKIQGNLVLYFFYPSVDFVSRYFVFVLDISLPIVSDTWSTRKRAVSFIGIIKLFHEEKLCSIMVFWSYTALDYIHFLNLSLNSFEIWVIALMYIFYSISLC